MKYKAGIKYDGSKFYGFQRLKNEKTVQGELEKALTKLNKEEVLIKGSGRTDRGAHAYNQVIHFTLKQNIPEDRLKNAINSIIDKSIYVNYTKVINEDFHSRFNVKRKTYKYRINLGEYNPIKKDYVYNYCKPLNIKNMKKASKYLLGYNCYKAYVSGKRDCYDSAIYNIKFEKEKDELKIYFEGLSFYNHMVRNLVGALILVGENKIKPIQLEEMLHSGENLYFYNTVPASGLYLVDIEY